MRMNKQKVMNSIIRHLNAEGITHAYETKGDLVGKQEGY